jgi:cystathionine beta-lyase
MSDKRERNLDFDTTIERRGTDSLKYDFAIRRGKPSDVLPLWVADMDFRTSSFILDALKERAEHGIFGYTETRDDYFEALAGWMKEKHGLTVEPRWVLKTPGVVFALAAAVKAYTQEGDYVLIQQPVYYPLMEVVQDNGRKVISNDLIFDGKHYAVDFEDFEQKIIDYQIKLFMLCSPHNPVGRVWTKEELGRLADICVKHGVIVVSDEIHEDFVYPGHEHVPFLLADERAKDFCITCTSVSKTFNLAGLQIANILVPDQKLRRRLRAQIGAAGYSQLNTFGVVACKAAYLHGNEWYHAAWNYIQENLKFLKEYLANEIPEVQVIEPEGTYLVWLNFRSLGLCDQGLSDLIIHKAKLWLDDGAIFGKQGSGFQRINLATSRATLTEALERIKKAISELKVTQSA